METNNDLQAGELPAVFRCKGWLVLAGLAVTVLALVVWGFAGRISENVNGHGVMTGRGAYVGVYAQTDGILASIDVRPGDRVVNGQVVAHVFSKEDVEALRRQYVLMEHYRRAFERSAELVERAKTLRSDYSREELKRLDDVLARQRKELEWYKDLLGRVPKMAQSGLISHLLAQEAQDKYDARLNAIDDFTTSKLKERFQEKNQLFQLDHDLFDFEVMADHARVEMEELLNTVNFSGCVFSSFCGEIVNVNVDVGDSVKNGQELARVMVSPVKGSEVWEVYGYCTAIDAMEIVPGMEALVIPSVVRVEEDGAIRGFVSSVGAALETEESIRRTFRSDGFARTVCRACNEIPVQVKVMLVRDATTPTGFAWTSGRGPDLAIPHGTFCFLTFHVRDHSPMQILLGKARRVMFGDGIEQSDYLKSLSLRRFERGAE